MAEKPVRSREEERLPSTAVRHDPARCPICALPLRWVQFPGTSRAEHRCTGWERHAHIDAMKRAASACRVAGYESYADAIVADLDRLTTPTTATRAA